MTTYDRVDTERCGYILLIGMKAGTSLEDPKTLVQLAHAFSELEATDELRCGVLFSHGLNFAAPHRPAAEPAGSARPRLPLHEVDPCGDRGRVRTKPVICAIRGRASVWGTKVALRQDAIVAADDAILTLPAEKLTAVQALRVGLVQEVVPAGAQLRRALDVAVVLGARRSERVPVRRRQARSTLEDRASSHQQLRSNWG